MTQIYIRGSGFTDPSTVRLGTETLEVKHVEFGLAIALVPYGLTPGFYDVIVETTNGQATLPNGYEVIATGATGDLRSAPERLWSAPSPLRVGYSQSSVGLMVQNSDPRESTPSVTVEFRLNSSDGELLGRGTTPLLGPGRTESTTPVTWEPTNAGSYTICAIIDPDNEIDETDEENNTVCRAVRALRLVHDIVPPEIDSFVIADGTEFTEDANVTLDVSATDYPIPGASGVSVVNFIEFEYSLGAGGWVPVNESGWIDYETAQVDYPWSLTETYGMRYMQVWAADNETNIKERNTISQVAGADVINLLPKEQSDHVAQHGIVFYRIRLEEGDTFVATLTPVNGDPDLYVWGASGELWHSNSYTGVETVTFQAPITGTYQIEVRGFSDADYTLTFGETNISQSLSLRSQNAGPKPVPTEPGVSLEEWPQYFPSPPSDSEHRLYLPITIN